MFVAYTIKLVAHSVLLVVYTVKLVAHSVMLVVYTVMLVATLGHHTSNINSTVQEAEIYTSGAYSRLHIEISSTAWWR